MPPSALAHREPTTIAPEASPRARRNGWRLFAVLLLLTVALRLPGFFVDVFNSDETFLATQAHVIRDGGNLYREAADRKPPLVPYVYAVSFEFFGSTALWTVRLVAMLAIAFTAWLLACEALPAMGTPSRGGSPGSSASSRWSRSPPRTVRPPTSRCSCCRR